MITLKIGGFLLLNQADWNQRLSLGRQASSHEMVLAASPLTEEEKGAEWSQEGPRNLSRESYWLAEAWVITTLLNVETPP